MSIDRHAYMASREWALKREAVRERSMGLCERCWTGQHQATHHLSYEHLGDEPLDELWGVCDPCHEWLSGKSDADPVRYVDAVVVAGLWWNKTAKFRAAGKQWWAPDEDRFPTVYQT